MLGSQMYQDLLEDIIVQMFHIFHWILTCWRSKQRQVVVIHWHRIETKQYPSLMLVLFHQYQIAFKTWEIGQDRCVFQYYMAVAQCSTCLAHLLEVCKFCFSPVDKTWEIVLLVRVLCQSLREFPSVHLYYLVCCVSSRSYQDVKYAACRPKPFLTMQHSA